VHILSPFDNELIKHNLREEWDDMYEIKITMIHKIYKQVFKQLYKIIMSKLTEQKWIIIKRQLQDNKQIVIS
jgi:hypothetical protein